MQGLPMDFPKVLSEETTAEFAERGFVVTENVLSAAELDRFGSAIDAQIAERTRDDKRTVREKSTYEQSFIQCMRLWETCPVVSELSFSPVLAGIAAQLLAEPTVLMWQDQALYKEAGGRETTPHQDQPFWPIGAAPLVSAWIPLQDVTEESGAMAYVPGSHRAGGLQVVDITHRSEPYDILSDPAIAGVEPVLVTPAAGSVVWHDGFTVHQAAANRTPETRRAFTVVYLAAGYRRAKSRPVFPLDRAGVGKGELMEGEGMPQVWPPLDNRPAAPARRGQRTGPQY
ncbi:MAG: hypothetical protein CMD83_11575 [Gammaproteobacteria bacterium]|nr:hypothetical protein [Gammaproteobacteria bacterium]